MNKLLILAILIGLTGCGTTGPAAVLPNAPSTSTEMGKSPASGKDIEKAKSKVEIPEDVLKECPELKDLTTSNPSGDDALKQKSIDAGMYSECRRKNKLLVDILRRAFNIK